MVERVVVLVVAGMLFLAPSAPAARCTAVPAKGCLLPFPNDATMTKPDKGSQTGVRVALRRALMPVNTAGTHVATDEINRDDGFSPGQTILARVPFLNSPEQAAAKGIVGVTNLAAYADRAQPLLLLDEQTGARQLVWGEIDVRTGVNRLLMIHPGKNLAFGHRYVVVLRNLGHKPPRPLALSKPIRAALAKAKAAVSTLYSAWDFTVASQASMQGRLLAVRDDAFRLLGDTTLADGIIQGAPPQYVVTRASDIPPSANPNVARVITGTITVPCYLVGENQNCPVGARFNYATKASDATPSRNLAQTRIATFQCNVPQAARTSPSGLLLFGHGLLGDESAINNPALAALGQARDLTICATQFTGMAQEDSGSFVAAFGDLSKIAALADRTQQGLLNNLYLARLMAHPQGFAADPRFAGLIDPSRLAYLGQSQGSILGGALTAVAPDWQHSVLMAPGMNWGTLLPRSSKFPQTLSNAYRDRSQQLIGMAAVQAVWDRAEPEGWAANATSAPPPGTPAHEILMQVAVGDPQVSTVTADTEARTIGASTGALPTRSNELVPLFGVPPITSYPFAGSAIVYFDNGPQTPLPPTTDLPQTTGADPHNEIIATRAARDQAGVFLAPGGTLIDVCGGQPCRTDSYG